MKQIAAILLLLVLVFNFYGYQWMISYLKNNTVVTIENHIDRNNYSDHDLISIKTKLNLPYYSSSIEYERTFGSITINGKDYEYVKRRVYKDTLELLCLPNYSKTVLQSISNEITKSSAEGQSANNKNAIKKINLPDLFRTENFNFYPPTIIAKQAYYSSIISFFSKGFPKQHDRPPVVTTSV